MVRGRSVTTTHGQGPRGVAAAAAEYYHTGAGAYITRPPLSLPTGISVNLRLLGVTGRTETRLYMRVSLRCADVGARTREREGLRCGGTEGVGDGRKNDGHKYRSYLCFMTVRPRYRQEESARIRGKALTIDSQILTDVLAQWIPVSPRAASLSDLFFSLLSFALPPFLPSRGRRTRFRSPPHGERCITPEHCRYAAPADTDSVSSISSLRFGRKTREFEYRSFDRHWHAVHAYLLLNKFDTRFYYYLWSNKV